MMKQIILIALFSIICSFGFAQKEELQDYWVYVRLEDRSGVTQSDDAGRSKRGDVVAVLPVTPQHIPSEKEKKEWMIYKVSLTEEQAQELIEPWIETDLRTDTLDVPKEIWENPEKKQNFLESVRSVAVLSEKIDLTGHDGKIDTRETKQFYQVELRHEYQKTKAYRKNKLDVSKLGVPVKKGLVTDKIDSNKIQTMRKTSDDLSRYELKRKIYVYVQLPLIRLASLVTPKAFADAENISTINKPGEDYNTLTLWEDATDYDLVTAQVSEVAECYSDDGVLDNRFTVLGATTSPSYHRMITVADGHYHNGQKNNGFIMTGQVPSGWSNIISIEEWHFILEKIALKDLRHGDIYGAVYAVSYTRCSDITIRNIFIYDSSIGYNRILGISVESESVESAEIYDNIIDNLTSVYAASGIALTYRTGQKVYNNTISNISCIYGSGEAAGISITSNSNTNIVKNNIVVGHALDDFRFAANVTRDYNASSDSTATGENSITGLDSSIFVDAANGDFRLASGAAVIDAGVDLGSPYNVDIVGTLRPQGSAWDIGAFEYISAAPAGRRRIMYVN